MNNIKEHNEQKSNKTKAMRTIPYLTSWELMSEDIKSAEAIIAFSFGYGNIQNEPDSDYHKRVHSPGISNNDIADLIAKDYEGKPIFAQEEIADSLEGRYNIMCASVAIKLKGYLGTAGVLSQYKNNNPSLDSFKKISIYAHPHHIFRCALTTTYSFEKSNNPIPEILIPNVKSVRFDENSIQPWTTNEDKFRVHELASRFYGSERDELPQDPTKYTDLLRKVIKWTTNRK